MTGLVLSGGGARGFAHVGVLKALQELGIKPEMISGVSSGAVMGAYYAAGFSFDDIIKIVQQTELFHFRDLSILKPGLFTINTVKKCLEKQLKNLTLEQLRIPLIVSATDFREGKSVYFSKGDLVEALLASSAIPVLYQPVIMNEQLLVDGGLVNNFPVEPLLNVCDTIIGVHVNPLRTVNKNNLNIPTVIDHSFHLAIMNSVRRKQQQCTLFIEPAELIRYGMFDMNDAEAIAAIGYQCTMGLGKEIEELRIQVSSKS